MERGWQQTLAPPLPDSKPESYLFGTVVGVVFCHEGWTLRACWRRGLVDETNNVESGHREKYPVSMLSQL